MLRKTAIKEVPVGTTVEVWNRKFTVLNKGWQSNALVLAADVEKRMAFRKDDEACAVAPNDFRDSTIRNWLNDDYLGELQEDGLKNGEILDTEIDLKCTLGQHEYGKDRVKAGLLTLEQYGEYYDIIPKTDSSWWLVTPWATPSRSTNTCDTNYVWLVYTSGDCVSRSYRNTYGVRPALTLSSSLLVAWEDDSKANAGWDAYIRYLHKWVVEHSGEACAGSCPAAYQDFEEWAYSTKEEKEDVAPVVHGRWIGEGDGYDDNGAIVYDVWHCSECDYCIDDGTEDPEDLPNYCPHCGARMDGEEDIV